MKKIFALLCVLLLTIPGFASASPNWTYVQVADFISDQEISCHLNFSPGFSKEPLDIVSVRLPDTLSQEAQEAIQAQQIALIAPFNYKTVGSETSTETENIEPAVFYAVINSWSNYSEKENSVDAIVCNLCNVIVDLPNTVSAKQLVTQGETRKVIMFAPYAIDGESYTEHVSAKEIQYPTFACGYVTDFDSDFLQVDTLPYDEIRTANQAAERTPMRFNLTDETLAVEHIEDGLEVVVVYDEETMNAVALFFFYG